MKNGMRSMSTKLSKGNNNTREMNRRRKWKWWWRRKEFENSIQDSRWMSFHLHSIQRENNGAHTNTHKIHDQVNNKHKQNSLSDWISEIVGWQFWRYTTSCNWNTNNNTEKKKTTTTTNFYSTKIQQMDWRTQSSFMFLYAESFLEE